MRELLQQVTVWFVPMVNPEGVELVQEGLRPTTRIIRSCFIGTANPFDLPNGRRMPGGSDLNDQFPAFWGGGGGATRRNRPRTP